MKNKHNKLTIKVIHRDYSQKKMTLAYYYTKWLSGHEVETYEVEYQNETHWKHTIIDSIIMEYTRYGWIASQKLYERLFNGQDKAVFKTR